MMMAQEHDILAAMEKQFRKSQPQPECSTNFCSKCIPSEPCRDDCHICNPSKINVQLLSDPELALELGEIRLELLARKEMLTPQTEVGRILHSRRAALLIERNQRFSR